MNKAKNGYRIDPLTMENVAENFNDCKQSRHKKTCIGYIPKSRLPTHDLISKHNLRDPCDQPDLNTEVQLPENS